MSFIQSQQRILAQVLQDLLTTEKIQNYVNSCPSKSWDSITESFIEEILQAVAMEFSKDAYIQKQIRKSPTSYADLASTYTSTITDRTIKAITYIQTQNVKKTEQPTSSVFQIAAFLLGWKG